MAKASKATGINPVRRKTPEASVTIVKKSTSNGIKTWPEDLPR